jgi:hyaluronoglucosaminidase
VTFAIRGVLEGFYDRLWTWEERARVAAFAARHEYTAFVHAPKEERGRNAGWRTGPSPADLAELGELAERCHRDAIELWAGIRPLGFDEADPADLDRVVARARDDLGLGVDRILLLADDLPDGELGPDGPSERLGESHARLVLGVIDRLRVDPSRLAFCPTDYTGAGSPYLAAIGRHLPPEVDVCWTGRDVVVPTIAAAEADAVAGVIGRPPLVWDNYPVNDDGMVDQLHLGPLHGRDPELDGHVRGVLVNAALQPEATLVPLATAAEYLRDPAGYDPDAAFRRALEEVTGDAEDADAVAAVAAALDRSAMRHGWEPPDRDVLEAAIQRVGRLRNERLGADLRPFLPRG